jgi:hypothetical protein
MITIWFIALILFSAVILSSVLWEFVNWLYMNEQALINVFIFLGLFVLILVSVIFLMEMYDKDR